MVKYFEKRIFCVPKNTLFLECNSFTFYYNNKWLAFKIINRATYKSLTENSF